MVGALAPTNFPAANPAVIKATLDHGGSNLVGRARRSSSRTWPGRRGSRTWWTPREFEIGENIAVTPGAVVLRTDVFELIQYEPRTSQVHEVPLLVVPPMINKYYITDLAEDRSMIQHQLDAGQQVFMHLLAQPGTSSSPTGAWTPTRPR